MQIPDPYTRRDLAYLLWCKPFGAMTGLIVIEALLSATTTYFVIQAGKHVANEEFLIADLLWILLAQALAYTVGAVSWVYAERAGFGAFGRYMLRFNAANRGRTAVLGDADLRERYEPFLTGEAFHVFFALMFELEHAMRLALGLIFNVIVLGFAIDGSFTWAYGVLFGLLFALQWFLRKPVARVYLDNQRMTNRMTAHTYTAWDNVYSGNRYNFRLWHSGFKQKLRDALRAQVRAIMLREGLSTISGIVGLAIIFAVMAYIASQNLANVALLTALAATLPKQIDLTNEVHSLAIGWNDLVAIWARMSGAAQSMHPEHAAGEAPKTLEQRMKLPRIKLTVVPPASSGAGAAPVELTCGSLSEVLNVIKTQRTGRIQVRGGNGAGKSTLLVALKEALGHDAFYWPTNDRLMYEFLQPKDLAAAEAEKASAMGTSVLAGIADPHAATPEGEHEDDNEVASADESYQKLAGRLGYSSGERQLTALTEIVHHTQAKVYLFDEWDANLDAANLAKADALADALAQRARVVEISHRKR